MDDDGDEEGEGDDGNGDDDDGDNEEAHNLADDGDGGDGGGCSDREDDVDRMLRELREEAHVQHRHQLEQRGRAARRCDSHGVRGLSWEDGRVLSPSPSRVYSRESSGTHLALRDDPVACLVPSPHGAGPHVSFLARPLGKLASMASFRSTLPPGSASVMAGSSGGGASSFTHSHPLCSSTGSPPRRRNLSPPRRGSSGSFDSGVGAAPADADDPHCPAPPGLRPAPFALDALERHGSGAAGVVGGLSAVLQYGVHYGVGFAGGSRVGVPRASHGTRAKGFTTVRASGAGAAGGGLGVGGDGGADAPFPPLSIGVVGGGGCRGGGLGGRGV
ncbi:hypothetical protein FOA52_015896 [Chlamydomonas sp. UWO 241]|nr:hypothetical protein FOA52_015896 [Chlamydomonas sp. UWO 241]